MADDDGSPSSPDRGLTELRPIPDPTRLTTEQLYRTVAGLRELIESRLAGIDARFNAMDKANDLLHDNLTQIVTPVQLDRQAEHLKEYLLSQMEISTRLADEKFQSIQTQFRERDVRSDQDKIAATTAVNAALQAQKEAAAAQNESNAAAITKSEASTTKNIDGIMLLINSNSSALNDKISDLRRQLDRGEGAAGGARETHAERRLDTGSLVSISAMIIAAGALLFAIYSHGSSSVTPVAQYVPAPVAPVTVPLPAR